MTVWYFGCATGVLGHYLIREGEHTEHGVAGPFGPVTIDGLLAPRGPETQGAAALYHRAGHTCLAWWDRTGDRRGGSNSALIVDRVCSAEDVLAEGARAFPGVMQRQTAPIVVVAACGGER